MTKYNISLVGNPNVGKTFFYNMLTSSFEHTGNWHGVTVDKKEKSISVEDVKYNIVDLPGIYSMTSYSFEEQVSIDYLLKFPTQIINICDANVLSRNLYLTLQLLESKLNPTLLINFDKEVQRHGKRYNYKALSNILNVKVVVNNYSSKELAIKDINNLFPSKTKHDLPYIKHLPISDVLAVLTPIQKQMYNGKEDFVAIKILEQDENVLSSLNLSDEQKKIIYLISERKNYVEYIASLRYQFIDDLMQKITVKHHDYVYGKFFLDKFILNKFLCVPIFFAIIFAIFYITFSSVGSYLSECLKSFIDSFIGAPIEKWLVCINAPNWIIGLFSGGLINGVGGLVSFIPQVVLLFFFLSLLEDSGYISRLSFCFEDIFYKFGLSGKSIFTLLMSFGCTTSSILTARTIEDKNTKIKTVIASPYMSCSAKLPIYAVIGGAFFGKGNILIIVLLYLLGIIVSLFVSSFLGKNLLPSGNRSFILEFPPYRFPNIKRVVVVILENCKAFLVKVSTILLSFSVIVWIMQNFSFSFKYVPDYVGVKSMLQTIGSFLAPLFAPIGLNNWGIVVSLIVGVMAKEMIVGTMAIINKVPATADFDKQLGLSMMTGTFAIALNPTTAIIMMIFSLLYFPCISTIAVMKKEIGFKWTFIACLIQFALSYCICFVVYNILSGGALAHILLFSALTLLVIFILLKSIKYSRTHSSCLSCPHKCSNKRC